MYNSPNSPTGDYLHDYLKIKCRYILLVRYANELISLCKEMVEPIKMNPEISEFKFCQPQDVRIVNDIYKKILFKIALHIEQINKHYSSTRPPMYTSDTSPSYIVFISTNTHKELSTGELYSYMTMIARYISQYKCRILSNINYEYEWDDKYIPVENRMYKLEIASR